ncbi:MAG: IclR family transcriptional regulator [bacterium]|nr:IclR family transcriptional regulator [bacterium]MDT8365656.1 IclR family transcriptional regulator [bacterium]
MIKRKKSDYIIHSVDHAFDVLEAFRADEPELGVTQLAKLLKLHKNNVFRILATLESRDYVEQNPRTGNYRLGLKAFEAGQAYLRHTSLVSVTHPQMEALSSELRENSYLAVLRGGYVFYLDEVIADQTIQVVSRLGTRVSPHCTATGKVFLAFLGKPMVDELFETMILDKMTPHTITDERKLKTEIIKVGESGYAVDNEEWTMGLKCVAAPILDYYGKIQGTISVSGPADRLPEEKIVEEIVPAVLDHSKKVSRKMGYLTGKGQE